jgi:cytochrome c biogenesis protein CcmG, thiol:disulfide interchange protein DsbE
MMILGHDVPPVNEAKCRFPRSDAVKVAVTKSTAVMLAGATFAVAILSLANAAAPASAAPEIDKPAPALVATTLDGQTFDLAKLKGKVVLVSYWATWCAPCKKDMPKLDAFYRSHHQRNLEMIGISVDEARDLPKVRKVMASLAYPVAVLKDITDNGFGDPEGVPITWIIDVDGKVRDRMIDVRDELLNDLVVPLLPH